MTFDKYSQCRYIPMIIYKWQPRGGEGGSRVLLEGFKSTIHQLNWNVIHCTRKVVTKKKTNNGINYFIQLLNLMWCYVFQIRTCNEKPELYCISNCLWQENEFIMITNSPAMLRWNGGLIVYTAWKLSNPSLLICFTSHLHTLKRLLQLSNGRPIKMHSPATY